MSLSAVLTAYVELVGDRLVNDCGAAVPRVLRYHGHMVPEDVQCSDGILAVWWEPSITPKSPGECQGYPVVTLQARYIVCWKSPEVDAEGITLFDATWDADAAALADIAECVTRSLLRFQCGGPGEGDTFEQALWLLVDSPKFLNSSPHGPIGGTAGVDWRMSFGIRKQNPPPPPPPDTQVIGRTATDSIVVNN